MTYSRSELEQIFTQAAEDEDDRYLLVIRKREGLGLEPINMLSTTWNQARVIDALASEKESNRYGLGAELVAIYDLQGDFDEQADQTLAESITHCLARKTQRRLRNYHNNTARMERHILNQGGWALQLMTHRLKSPGP